MASLTPIDLVVLGEDLLERDDTREPMWRRAAGLLLRSAIDDSLDIYWTHKRLPGMRQVSGRTRMATLETWLPEELAQSVRHAWSELSATGHHRAAAPEPLALRRAATTARELSRWVEDRVG